jgi:hypothetical protein
VWDIVDWNRYVVVTAPALENATAKPALFGEYAWGILHKQIGLRVGTHVGHEVEEHEANRDQDRVCGPGSATRKRSDQQPAAQTMKPITCN